MGVCSLLRQLPLNPSRVLPGFGYKHSTTYKPKPPQNPYLTMTGMLYYGQIEVLYNERQMTIEDIAKVAGVEAEKILEALYKGKVKLESIAKSIGKSRRQLGRIAKAKGWVRN